MSRASLLKKYIRPIIHMRQQLRGIPNIDGGISAGRKFGLVFGSGISKDYGLPDWGRLIENIAKDTRVKGEEILNYQTEISQASKTQMLYEHFRAKQMDLLSTSRISESKKQERLIFHNWRTIIHNELWKNFDDKFLGKDYHPYIDAYIDIIKQSNLTINYNFDDILQTLIMKRRSDDEIKKGEKLFETISDARLQFQLNKGIIYHPNGFLPRVLIDGGSDGLVFSEDSFADQLIASMTGHYSTLLHHLSKNTCLFIGLSLNDSTLKHLLRQSAAFSPGHCHYYVAFQSDKKISANQQKAIRESNFELYSLITLFLNKEDIKDLGELLQLSEPEFEDECRFAKVKRKFVFYVTGPVGSGKTTTVNYFRNLTTFSEWPETRHELLVKPAYQLTPVEKAEVDRWIANMFFKKNRNLSHIREGITVIDRTPLDPLTFTPKNSWRKKANSLNNDISQNAYPIVPGHVILLVGNKEVIEGRLKVRPKPSSYNANDVENMYKRYQEWLRMSHGGITRIVTTDFSILEVVKKVARVIHLENYSESELQNILDKLMK